MKQFAFEFAQPRRKKGKRGGRPSRGKVPHRTRPAHDRRHPVHVTLSTVIEVGYLRRGEIRHAVREAMTASITSSRTSGAFRICELSIQGRHLHLIAEAENRAALSRGIQGFKISCARRINAAVGARTGARRKGAVFADRFHARALRTPREVRAVLAYVLNNWRHHGASASSPGVAFDPYSTGVSFGGWDKAPEQRRYDRHAGPLPIWYPKSWLLRDGWKRHGLIRTWEVPG